MGEHSLDSASKNEKYLAVRGRLHANILIIYNPNAGRGKAKQHAESLAASLNKYGITVGQFFNSSSLEVMRGFHKSNFNNVNNYTAAVIIGGDGTIGPNVDAMIKNNINIPIYALGRGTANDFASFFHTNTNTKKAANIIACAEAPESGCHGRIKQIDTIKVDMPNNVHDVHYGVSDAAGGAFTNGVTKYSWSSKRLLGKFAYRIKAGVSSLFLKSQRMRFSADGEQFEESVFIFYILNTKNVGSMKDAAPLAKPDDGKLDLVIVKKCGLWGKLCIGFSLLFKRLHKSKYVIYKQGKTFKAEVIGEPIHNFTKTDTDGNIGGDYPLNVEVGPKISVITNN